MSVRLSIILSMVLFLTMPLSAREDAAKKAGEQSAAEEGSDQSTVILKKLQDKIKELEGKVKELQDQQDEMAIHQMKTDGKLSAKSTDKSFRMKDFRGHSRSLQGLNPEISLTGDFAGEDSAI